MVKFSTVLPIIAGLAGAAEAHTRVYSLWVNGVDQGDGRGVYVRSPPNNNPVKDVTSAGINCNVNNVAVAKSVSVAGGDTVTFEWYHDNRNDDIIDLSHLGPVTVYIAPSSSNGAGAVWTKLAESGLSNGVWAVQTLVANGGKHDVKLPATLAPGDYLLRAEIIGLHEAETDYTTNSVRGAQFYPSCSQIKVTSGGTAVPPGTFNFIGGYTHADPGILFSIYNGATSYPIPGPAVWVPTGTNSASTSSKSSTTSTSTPVSTSKPASSAAATTTSAAPAATAPVTVSSAEKYHQCGGKGFTGATACAAGSKCTRLNDYYYQCL